jgi:hypothetical protein
MTENLDEMERRSDGNLQQAAIAAVRASLEELLANPDDADLRDILPGDFAERLIEVAWQHQFDLDKARFRRAVKSYFSQIAAVQSDEVRSDDAN